MVILEKKTKLCAVWHGARSGVFRYAIRCAKYFDFFQNELDKERALEANILGLSRLQHSITVALELDRAQRNIWNTRSLRHT